MIISIALLIITVYIITLFFPDQNLSSNTWFTSCFQGDRA